MKLPFFSLSFQLIIICYYSELEYKPLNKKKKTIKDILKKNNKLSIINVSGNSLPFKHSKDDNKKNIASK